MRIDLHIHTRTGSDGDLPIDDVFREAKARGIDLMSVTDHDSVQCQESAIALARRYGISYVSGVELNVTFRYDSGSTIKSVSLDFLGYGYDIHNRELKDKLELIRERREWRARRILEKLNAEFEEEGVPRFSEEDIANIENSVDGAFGRPHIADYLISKGIVKDRQEAFDRYLVKGDVPKYPLSLPEASRLVRNAGGILIHAHPNDPHGTSLATLTPDLDEQTGIIEEHMLPHMDGVECWHLRHDSTTTAHYVEFAEKHDLVMTGGSDCHQRPIVMGTVDVPAWVAEQSEIERRVA